MSTTFLESCTVNDYKVPDFTKDELKWFKPYYKTDTVIFVSEKKDLDTIIFYKSVATTDKIRNSGHGSYNTNFLTVPYKLTNGSYHQSVVMSDGKSIYDHNIFNISKSSPGGYNQFEIEFIGTIFNGEELSHIEKKTENIYYFDSKKATYDGMGVKNGIKDFTFDTNVGILKFTDNRDIKWTRKKI